MFIEYMFAEFFAATAFLCISILFDAPPLSDTTLVGKVVRQNYVDKRGRVIKDVYDFFFETADERYFIKLSQSKVSKEALLVVLNKSVRCRAELLKGTWDSDVGASRIGTFIVIYELLPP